MYHPCTQLIFIFDHSSIHLPPLLTFIYPLIYLFTRQCFYLFSLCQFIHSFIQLCIHPSIHPPFIHPLILQFSHPGIHPFIQSSIPLLIPPSTYPSIYLLIHLSIYSSIHLSTQSSSYRLIYPLTHPHIHSFILPSLYFFIHSFIRPSISCLSLCNTTGSRALQKQASEVLAHVILKYSQHIHIHSATFPHQQCSIEQFNFQHCSINIAAATLQHQHCSNNIATLKLQHQHCNSQSTNDFASEMPTDEWIQRRMRLARTV